MDTMTAFPGNTMTAFPIAWHAEGMAFLKQMDR